MYLFVIINLGENNIFHHRYTFLTLTLYVYTVFSSLICGKISENILIYCVPSESGNTSYKGGGKHTSK